MLSSVLRSSRAIQVNILIMRAFVRLREMALTHVRIARELEKLRDRVDVHDESISVEVGPSDVDTCFDRFPYIGWLAVAAVLDRELRDGVSSGARPQTPGTKDGREMGVDR